MNGEVLNFFQTLSFLFNFRHVDLLWNQYPQAAADNEVGMRQALCLYLSGYAFERQGAAPDYAPAAVDMIQGIPGWPLDENRVWANFQQRLADQGLNEHMNPLWPNHQNHDNISLIQIATNLGPQSLVSWALGTIANNQLGVAHQQLCTIRGTGSKIASLFLRDVAVRHELDLNGIANRHLLQPIDTWVQYVVGGLINQDDNMPHQDCAAWIVEHALQNNLQPERVNQGIWYFCTAIARSSRYLVQQYLQNPEDVLRMHLEDLQRESLSVRQRIEYLQEIL
ncbi:MAG TPA: hypothetical protein PK054_03815 [Anaerohalosphaeraceae bacterium]|nr:hypothetical protein [Anaerohalosphaeraceae bacterium]HOL88801.1 hypothetical protein [Anaerohalosphaeraceae bacterium]HPP55689.1 hypothetical protein [Anaerohalosphaeraceae bacterium]